MIHSRAFTKPCAASIIIVAIAAAVTIIGYARPPDSQAGVDPSTIHIIDGDTVAIGRERIRLLDIDAPETFNAHCAAEHAAGARATAKITSMIRSASRVTIERAKRGDRYGRTLARIYVDGQDVGAVLVTQKLALPYRPGRDAHQQRIEHWCPVYNRSTTR